MIKHLEIISNLYVLLNLYKENDSKINPNEVIKDLSLMSGLREVKDDINFYGIQYHDNKFKITYYKDKEFRTEVNIAYDFYKL